MTPYAKILLDEIGEKLEDLKSLCLTPSSRKVHEKVVEDISKLSDALEAEQIHDES